MLSPGGAFHIPDIPAAAEAWIAWALARLSGRPLLWIGDGARTLEWRVRDFQTLTPPGSLPPLVFPSWEVLPSTQAATPDAMVIGARLETLAALSDPAPRLIATCAQALMESTLSPGTIRSTTRRLAIGDETDPTELVHQLEASGYSFSAEVQVPGDAALRGAFSSRFTCARRNYGAHP